LTDLGAPKAPNIGRGFVYNYSEKTAVIAVKKD